MLGSRIALAPTVRLINWDIEDPVAHFDRDTTIPPLTNVLFPLSSILVLVLRHVTPNAQQATRWRGADAVRTCLPLNPFAAIQSPHWTSAIMRPYMVC